MCFLGKHGDYGSGQNNRFIEGHEGYFQECVIDVINRDGKSLQNSTEEFAHKICAKTAKKRANIQKLHKNL